MSFCCDTGFTCFGLVKQDYKIPEEVLKNMNIKTIDLRKNQLKTIELKKINLRTITLKKMKYETIGIKVLNRDVIGVFKVGYTVK